MTFFRRQTSFAMLLYADRDRQISRQPVNEARLTEKLSVLADAAKYDVSCASSGSTRTNHNAGLGNASKMGICHSYTADGLHHHAGRVSPVQFVHEEEGRLPAPHVDAALHERAYIHLWKTYFHSVDIPERRNLGLQMQHMPKRHWKHMVEMVGLR